MISKLKGLLDSIVQLDEKVGFKRSLQYVTLCIILLGVFNYKTVLKDVITTVEGISADIHNEKLVKRDQLLSELQPILSEFRGDTGADRILYFEYHNSKENMVSIPFKYFDLVQQVTRYGIPPATEGKLKEINTGAIIEIYDDIKSGEIVHCKGPSDTTFRSRYPGTYELFHEIDQSKQFVFISIPGVRQPIGFIVLEWMSEDGQTLDGRVLEDTKPIDLGAIQRRAVYSYIPRITGLISSKA